ncbi:hypothetical protein JTE90_011512 [Oedothorax gibbosus]|uniref:Uncharacterized protein n=1 Tax=Oedothorax gibbosus TaxID=931172 RepID=A0AAV6TGH5_9ARAC|nr:hypothetical protein JTE90_011512 [Oedothorax gibbosus]
MKAVVFTDGASTLPLIYYTSHALTNSDSVKLKQGPSFPLIFPSPFLGCGFEISDRDSWNLVNPFQRVNNQMNEAFGYLKRVIVLRRLPELGWNFFT